MFSRSLAVNFLCFTSSFGGIPSAGMSSKDYDIFLMQFDFAGAWESWHQDVVSRVFLTCLLQKPKKAFAIFNVTFLHLGT